MPSAAAHHDVASILSSASAFLSRRTFGWDRIDANEPSTKAQRRALHRLGRSDWFIKRFCQTKDAASAAIKTALQEREALQ